MDLTRNEVRNVKSQLEKAESLGSGNRKPYVKWTPEQRAQIGERANKHGISSALKHFAGEYPNLKKRTVYEFKMAYEKLKSSQQAEILCNPLLLAPVKKHKIPEELILNYDQTPLSYVCTSNTTLEVRGSKSVPIVGKGKQTQITGTFTVSADGDFNLCRKNRSLSSKWNKLSRRSQYNPYSKSLVL